MPTTFGLLLFDGVEELDFVGPWEVFTASSMLRENTGEAADTIVTISEHDRPVRCSKGLRVLADHTFENHPNLDVVLAPGGFGTRTEVDNPVLIDWLRNVAASCDWVTSVCTGSLLLHEAGPGRNRHLCTHWGFEDTLEARGNCTIVRDHRWAVDGNLVTSQGVSAGIDMALWLIGQIYTPDHARGTQHYIQYDPAPPILRQHLIGVGGGHWRVIKVNADRPFEAPSASGASTSRSSPALSPHPPNASEFR